VAMPTEEEIEFLKVLKSRKEPSQFIITGSYKTKGSASFPACSATRRNQMNRAMWGPAGQQRNAS